MLTGSKAVSDRHIQPFTLRTDQAFLAQDKNDVPDGNQRKAGFFLQLGRVDPLAAPGDGREHTGGGRGFRSPFLSLTL